MTLGGRTRPWMACVSLFLIVSAAAFVSLFSATTPLTTHGSAPQKLGSVTVVDPRPDPSIASSDLYVLRDGLNLSSSTFGYTVTIHAIVYNLGSSNVTNLSVMLGVRSANETNLQYNQTLFEGTYNVSSYGPFAPYNFVDISYAWQIQITHWLDFEIWALLDPEGQIDEQNETNNMAVIPFTINPLNLDMIITTDGTEYEAGDVVIFTDVIYYAGTVTPVPLLPGLVFMVVNWYTTAEVPNTRTVSQTADIYGFVIGAIQLPADLVPGMYAVWAEFLGNTYSGYLPTAITVKAHAEPISSIVIAGIVVVIVLAIVAIAVYVMLRKPRPG
jgi:hypothetical protein